MLAITAFGVGDILGAGVYGLVGKVTGCVGPAAWMSYVLAGLVAALTGLTYAEWTSRHPRAGGAAHFCESAYRVPLVTFLVIFFVAMSGIFSMATASKIFANYAMADMANVPSWCINSAVPILFVLLLTAVALRGIHLSSATNFVCTAIEVAGLLIILVLGARFLGRADYLSFAAADVTHSTLPAASMAVVTGASLAFYAFIGFEDLSNLSEETLEPERVIPYGICLSILITVLIYCGIAIVSVSVLTPQALASTKSPLLDVVRTAEPGFPAGIYSVIPAFAVFNTALLNLIMVSRLLFGMSRSRARLLPGALGTLHPRWHTPIVALVLAACVVTVLLLTVGDVKTLASGTSSCLLIVFVMLHIGLIVEKRRPGSSRPLFRIPIVVPVLGAATAGLLLIGQDPTALRAAGAMTAVALAFYLVLNLIRGRVEVEAVD